MKLWLQLASSSSCKKDSKMAKRNVWTVFFFFTDFVNMRSLPAIIQHTASKEWRYPLTNNLFLFFSVFLLQWFFNVLAGCFIIIFSHFLCLLGVVLSSSGQQIPKQWSHLQNQMRWSSLDLKSGHDKQSPNIYVSTVGRYCSIHFFASSVIFIPCNIFVFVFRLSFLLLQKLHRWKG